MNSSLFKFKEGIIKLRKSVEEFKDNHKMASEAISEFIESDFCPWPFKPFCKVIWNGLEKKEEEGSSSKMLEILEKIENNDQKSFSGIESKISELIQLGAKDEDLQKIGEQIRNSNQSIIQNLKSAFEEQLKKATKNLQESFDHNLTDLQLSDSNLVVSSPPSKESNIRTLSE